MKAKSNKGGKRAGAGQKTCSNKLKKKGLKIEIK